MMVEVVFFFLEWQDVALSFEADVRPGLRRGPLDVAYQIRNVITAVLGNDKSAIWALGLAFDSKVLQQPRIRLLVLCRLPAFIFRARRFRRYAN